MFMMCRVCAQFRDAHGKVIFTVDRGLVNQFMEVPDAIQEDPLFAMLLADGSVKANVSPAERRTLENDPMAGAGPDGKQKTEPQNESATGADAAGKKKPVKPATIHPKAEAKGNEDAEKKDGSGAATAEK